jgi:glutamate-1-semialdehyde 2,1-aminomutase
VITAYRQLHVQQTYKNLGNYMQNLVGDVSSAARILPELDGEKLFISRGKGAYLWDNHGRQYIDTALGFGAVLAGHSNDAVIANVTQALNDAAAPSWAHVREHGAASALAARTGALSKVIFTNSGSEAVHLACRAARAYTGKSKIAKMAAGFDGWFDDVSFGNIGSAEALFDSNQRPSTERTTLLRFNDFEDVERLFAEHTDVAAVLVEPMLANAGCIMAAPGYLKHVQDIAHKHGALVIGDEVLMGFRLFDGLTSHQYGLDPDLATVGKAIGNGVPVSALLGKPEVLAAFDEGRVLRGGTFSGNPMACAAVTSTLQLLEKADYSALNTRGDELRAFIKTCFRTQGVPITTSGYGSVFTIWLGDEEPTTYNQATQIANVEFSRSLHLALRKSGVLMMPSPYGRIFLSFEHTDSVIEEMKQAFTTAAKEIAKEYAA